MVQVVAAVDGTQIPVKKPPLSGDEYFSHKGYCALNVHAVCDHQGRFIDVDVGYAGRAHDAWIWVLSVLGTALATPNSAVAQQYEEGALSLDMCGTDVRMPYLVIADSAYPCLPYLLPAFKEGEARLSNERALFNRMHASTRNVIERAYGMLKKASTSRVAFALQQPGCQLDALVAACCS